MSPARVDRRIRELHRRRPSSRLLRASLVMLAAVVTYAWIAGDFSLSDFFSERRLENLERFGHEIKPYPTRETGLDLTVVASWGRQLLDAGGTVAVERTLAISILAIVLAQLLALILALPAARNFATGRPLFEGPERVSGAKRWGYRAVVAGSRATQMVLRAVPEYIWAFLLIGVLGISAWPAVLALALHNAGILGKLGAETLENLPAAPLAGLRRLGATRLQVAAFAAVPQGLPRLLLYFFYRWETCVREATVLGMLGIASLGAVISEARVRDRYDEMLFFVALGSALVLAGDIASALARRAVRRAR